LVLTAIECLATRATSIALAKDAANDASVTVITTGDSSAAVVGEVWTCCPPTSGPATGVTPTACDGVATCLTTIEMTTLALCCTWSSAGWCAIDATGSIRPTDSIGLAYSIGPTYSIGLTSGLIVLCVAALATGSACATASSLSGFNVAVAAAFSTTASLRIGSVDETQRSRSQDGRC